MLNLGFTIIQNEIGSAIEYKIEYFVRLRAGMLVSGDIREVLKAIASDDLRQALEDEAVKLAAYFKSDMRESGEQFFEVDFLVYGDEFDIFLPGFDEVTPLFVSADDLIAWFTEDTDDEPTSTIPGL
jgi:hypothetical protein